MQRNQYIKLSQNLLNELPPYVLEYYNSKNTKSYSYRTLYQYLAEYKRFFTWMINSNIVSYDSIKEISLDDLANLPKIDAESYISYLQTKPEFDANGNEIPGTQLSVRSINICLTSLKSLFKYLSEETEDTNGEPYFYRNVMKKIPSLKTTETLNYRADKLSQQMVLGKEKFEFIHWIENAYPSTLTPQQLSFYNKNKIRDLAIIALLLGTGMRVSEAVNINLNDLNISKQEVFVIRKGNYKDIAGISSWAIPYLNNYLEIRSAIYIPEKNEKALFLTRSRGKTSRISSLAIERFVKKYSTAFGKPMTPHKFRHTVATEIMDKTKDERLVASVLGQTTTSATSLYTHVLDKQRKNIIKNLNNNDYDNE